MLLNSLRLLLVKLEILRRVPNLEAWQKILGIRLNRMSIDKKLVYHVGLDVLSSDSSRITLSGCSSNYREAALKAVSEFCEAIVCWEENIDWKVSRSGMACHKSHSLARNSAFDELVERDSFLTHLFLPGLRTYRLPSSLLGEAEIEIKCAQLQTIKPSIFVVLAASRLAEGEPQTVALGSGSSIELARQKAVEECSMLTMEWSIQEQLFPERNTARSKIHRAHFQASTDPYVKSRLDEILSASGDGERATVPDLAPKVTLHRQLSDRLHVVRCDSNELLKIGFGEQWSRLKEHNTEIVRQRDRINPTWFTHPLI